MGRITKDDHFLLCVQQMRGKRQFHVVFHEEFYDCKEHHLGCISYPESLKCFLADLGWTVTA